MYVCIYVDICRLYIYIYIYIGIVLGALLLLLKFFGETVLKEFQHYLPQCPGAFCDVLHLVNWIQAKQHWSLERTKKGASNSSDAKPGVFEFPSNHPILRIHNGLTSVQIGSIRSCHMKRSWEENSNLDG